MALQDRLLELIEPIVTERGLELFDLVYAGGTLTVMVQRPEPGATGAGAGTGVDVGAITDVSRAVSRMLDDVDPIHNAFSLEVSSPGLERPLRTLVHFTGAIGEIISVKTEPGFDGPRRIKGELLGATDDDITLRPSDGAPDATVTIPLVAIDKARTVFEWAAEPKKTRPQSSKAKPAKGQPAKGQATKKHATKKVTSS
jgi:ribosome maturation factor RimP